MSFSFVKGAILVRIEGGRCIMGRVFLIAKESWLRVAGSLRLGGLLLTLSFFLFVLYCSIRSAISSSCTAKYKARRSASSSEVGACTAIYSLNLDENETRSLILRERLPHAYARSWLWCLWICWCTARGSNGTFLGFQKSSSVALVFMKTEYYFRKVDTSWVKLSMEFPSEPTTHSRAGPTKFSAKKRQ